ncbi:MAG: hypothetical protein ACRBB4_13825 [Neptuniibacter sp.]
MDTRSSDSNIELSAQLGLGFVLTVSMNVPQTSFCVSENVSFTLGFKDGNPQATISSAVICTDTQEEAELLAASHTYWKVQAHPHGIREGIKPPEECLDLYKKLRLSDQEYFDVTRNSMVTGTPVQCKEQLEAQAECYGVDEVLAVAVTYSFQIRYESYLKLTEAFS